MPTLVDDTLVFLRSALGKNGTLNDLLYEYYKRETGASGSFNDVQKAYFEKKQGRSGSINDLGNVNYGLTPKTNLVTNPKGRKTVDPVVVRENKVPYPSATHVDSTAWWVAARYSLARDTSVFRSSGASYRLQRTEDSTLQGYLISNTTNRMPVVSGAKIFYSAYVRPATVSGTYSFQVYEFDAAAAITVQYGPLTMCPAGQWTRLQAEFTLKPTTVTIRILVLDPGNVAVGNVFNVDDIHWDYSPGDYFDGDASPDPDLTASWVGTPGASISGLTGQQVAINVAGAVTYYSPTRDMMAVRVTDPTVSGGPQFRAVLATGGPITLTAEAYFSEPGVLGSFTSDGLPSSTGSGAVNYPSGTVVNYRSHYTSTILNNPIQLTLGVGLKIGYTVYVRWGAFEGDYQGPYFDGDYLGCTWNGVPHESTSTYRGPGRYLV